MIAVIQTAVEEISDVAMGMLEGAGEREDRFGAAGFADPCGGCRAG